VFVGTIWKVTINRTKKKKKKNFFCAAVSVYKGQVAPKTFVNRCQRSCQRWQRLMNEMEENNNNYL